MRFGELVDAIYGRTELPPELVEAAGWQIHAHLLELKADGKVVGTSAKAAWRAA